MDGFPSKNNANILQQWSGLFKCHGGESSLHALAHWRQAQRIGWPTRKHEDWKYTPIEMFLDQQFIEPISLLINTDQCNSLALNIEAYRLVFIDGRFNAKLSDPHIGDYRFELVKNNTLQTLPDPIQPEFFLHLTESLAQETSLIYISDSKDNTIPIYLLHISTGKAVNEGKINAAHHRHHLIIECGAQAEVIEHYVSLSNTKHFTGARLTVNVGDNAKLSHYKLVFESHTSYHFAHNDIILGYNAYVKSDSFLLGAGLTRHNTSAKFNGTGSQLNINSLLLPIGKEIGDTRTYIEHNKGYCHSQQLHKIAVCDTAKAIFNGMIKVAKHAIKTDGKMTNHNLLISKEAEVNTKPQLEIYADDVKCRHGATVGYLDEEQLFYMQSRGIDNTAAKKIIMFAFASELTENITNKILQQLVLTYIAQRLPKDNV